MGRRRFATALALIALAGLGWRVGYTLAATRHQPGPVVSLERPEGPPPRAVVRRSFDEIYYVRSAVLMTEGKPFTKPFPPDGENEAVHPPLTHVVLAPVAYLTDDSEMAMRFTAALAGTTAVVLIGLTGRQVAGSRAGLVAAGLAAAYPNLWMHDGLVMSESFSAATTAAAIWSTYRLVSRPTWTRAAGVGVVCGLAALTRSELLLLVPMVAMPAVWVAASALSRRRRAATIAVVVAATALTIAPWIAYNLSRFEEPVLISYGDGPTLKGANCDETFSGPAIGYWDGYCAAADDPVEPSVDAAVQRQQGLRYMADHADRVPLVVAARVGRVWGAYKPMAMLEEYQAEGKPLWASVPGWVASWVLVPFAVYGAVVLRRRSMTIIPLVGVVLIVTVVAAAFYGLLRNRVPAEVVLVLLAAVGINAVLERFWTRQGKGDEPERPRGLTSRAQAPKFSQ